MENIWKKFLQGSSANAYSTPKTETAKRALGIIIKEATLGRLKEHPKSSVLFGCAVACMIVGIVNQPQYGHAQSINVKTENPQVVVSPQVDGGKLDIIRMVEPSKIQLVTPEPQPVVQLREIEEVKPAKLLPAENAIDYNYGAKKLSTDPLSKVERPNQPLDLDVVADADTEKLSQALKQHSGQTSELDEVSEANTFSNLTPLDLDKVEDESIKPVQNNLAQFTRTSSPNTVFDLDAVPDADTAKLAEALKQHSGQMTNVVMDLDAVADADTDRLVQALKQHSGQIQVSEGLTSLSPLKQQRVLEIEYKLLEQRSALHLISEEDNIKNSRSSENSGFSCYYVSTEVIQPGEIVNWVENTLKHAEVRAIDCNDVTAYNAKVSKQLQNPEIIAHMKEQVESFAKIGLPYNALQDSALLQAIRVEPIEQALARAKLMNVDFLDENEDKITTIKR